MLPRILLPFMGLVACTLPLFGCQRGYQSAKDLQKVERGPTHCARSCQDLGMRMSAFVLVEADVAGCVCEPLPQAPAAPYPAPPPPPPPPAAPSEPVSSVSTGAAAGYVVLQARRAAEEEQRRQQDQQQQQQQQQRQWRQR